MNRAPTLESGLQLVMANKALNEATTMRTIISVSLLCSAVIAPAQQRFADPGPPPPPSIVSASAYIDRAEAELDRLLETIHQPDAAAAKDTLHAYTQALSRFHVELGQIRVAKQERRFLTATVDRLGLQATTLQAATEAARPDLTTALEQAASHVRGTLQLAEQRLKASRRNRLLFFRPSRQGPGYYGVTPTQSGLPESR